MNFIYTINPKWSCQVIKDMTQAGIHNFRVNAVRHPKSEINQIVNQVKQISSLNNIFFDLPGVKARIWCFDEKKERIDVCKNKVYEFVLCKYPRRSSVFQITGDVFFMGIACGTVLKVRRNSKPLIRFSVLHKDLSFKKIIAQALDDGIIGWGYHIYSETGSCEQHTIPFSDLEYVHIINDCHPQNVSVSFVDHADMISDLKKHLKYNECRIFAKIETRFGVDNINEIARVSDGIIIARDDLSAYFSAFQISEITDAIIDICKSQNKISIPASNYFTTLCNSDEISSFEFEQLKYLSARGQKYIYCNETNKCDDWTKFRRVEMLLNE